MRYEYKELFKKLKNNIEDLNHYSNNEGSLSEQSQEELEKLERHIKTTLQDITDRED